MRQQLEVCLDRVSDFLWAQFQKDIELSERVVASFDNALNRVYDFFLARK